MLDFFRLARALLTRPGALAAFLFWPRFSISSFLMVSDLLHQINKPKTVIDVGANVGQFTVAASKLFSDAQVHAFEPVPECVTTLRKTVSSLPNVTIHPVALGDRQGVIDFHVNSHTHSSSVLPLGDNHLDAFPEAQHMELIQIEMSTLDRAFGNAELEGPVLLKLDVQGYEYQVLRGSTGFLKKVDYIVLESSFKKMYEGEILFVEMLKLLEDLGFGFIRPVGLLRDPRTDEIIQMDALFQRRDANSGIRP